MTLHSERFSEAFKRMLDDGDVETLTYKPRSGSNRSVKALVKRNPPELLSVGGGGGGGAISKFMVVEVLNQATDSATDSYGGVSATELDTGGDRFTIADRKGATASDRPITKLLKHTSAVVQLEVR